MVFTSSSSNLSPLAPPFTVERPSVSRSLTIPLADLPDSFYLPDDRSPSNAYFPLNSSITIRHPDSDPLLPSSLDYSLFYPPTLNCPQTTPELVYSSTTLTSPSSDYTSKLNPTTDHPISGFHENEKGEFVIKTRTMEISNVTDSVLFLDQDGKFDAEKSERFMDSLSDRDDDIMNTVEDSPCWIPRFPFHTKQNNEVPLGFNQEMESSAFAASTSVSEASPVSTTPSPLSYNASTNTLKAKTLVCTLGNLSDSLMSQCSELREEDCDALKLVIEKLSACVQKKTGRPTVPLSPNHFEEMFGEMKQQEEATKAIKKIVAESLRIEGEDSSQARLYKNLWLEAEASQFCLTYMNRFNLAKMELEKYGNETPIVADFAALNKMTIAATNHSTTQGDDAERFKEDEESNLGSYSFAENYGRKAEGAEGSVMARLEILKRRERMLV